MLKITEEVDYFAPKFMQTYDDLNSAMFEEYKQEIAMEYMQFDKSVEDVFSLGAITIENYMLEKAYAEYFYVVNKNRELAQKSEVEMVDTRSIVSSIPTKGLWAPNSVFFGEWRIAKRFCDVSAEDGI